MDCSRWALVVGYARSLRRILAQRRACKAPPITDEAISAMIAHEVRQPLSAMIAYADAGLHWLDRAAPDIDEARAALRQIVTNGHRAAAMIEAIRANFKSDARGRGVVDVSRLIGETLDLLGAELEKHRISTQAELSGNLPQIQGDWRQLQEVLLNLVGNAIDSIATNDGARELRVRAKADRSRRVVISVEDNGTGIAPKDIRQVFDPLFTTKPNGMGMGLCICQSIIKAHGGELWVEQNIHEGAVFQFILPAYNEILARPVARDRATV